MEICSVAEETMNENADLFFLTGFNPSMFWIPNILSKIWKSVTDWLKTCIEQNRLKTFSTYTVNNKY